MAKKDEKEPKIDFEKHAKRLKDSAEKAKVDQIGPSITNAYLEHAKYTDENGVIHFKTKFTTDEAESLGDKVYDTLGYHIHRRYFNIDESKYQALLGIKDPNGVPYVDTMVRYHMGLDRTDFKNQLKSIAEKDDPINHSALEKMLEKGIKRHIGLMQGEIIKDIGDPENMDALKEHIGKLVSKHKLPKKKWDVSKVYDMEELVKTYIDLVSNYYSEDYDQAKAA